MPSNVSIEVELELVSQRLVVGGTLTSVLLSRGDCVPS